MDYITIGKSTEDLPKTPASKAETKAEEELDWRQRLAPVV